MPQLGRAFATHASAVAMARGVLLASAVTCPGAGQPVAGIKPMAQGTASGATRVSSGFPSIGGSSVRVAVLLVCPCLASLQRIFPLEIGMALDRLALGPRPFEVLVLELVVETDFAGILKPRA